MTTLSVLGCSCHPLGASWSPFAADPFMAPDMGACARWCGEDTSAQATSSSTLVGLHCWTAQGGLIPPECLILCSDLGGSVRSLAAVRAAQY